jgi:inositol oxygenase
MYLIAKEQSTIPKEGLAMIRFHSFYPWHRENAYRQFMKANGEDEALLAAVREFNPYDLYSKADTPIDVDGVKEYYEKLIAKYFPPIVEW